MSVTALARLIFVSALLLTTFYGHRRQACGQGTAPGAASITPPAPGGSAPAAGADPSEVERIIRSFAAKETQFRKALNQYTFRREAVVQTIGMGKQISGEYYRLSRFIFDDSGNKFEKIDKFPIPTLRELQMSPEDLEDLGGIQPFALEAGKIDRYHFAYVGKEKIDELDLHVFDVSPKAMPDPDKTKERFFQGRIWVDDQDLQIVKARGKGVPEGKQRFPTFETYREQIDGRYWFPTYTYADEDLVFPNGQVVHLRMRVKYSNFERPRGRATIIEEDVVPAEKEPSRTPDKPERK